LTAALHREWAEAAQELIFQIIFSPHCEDAPECMRKMTEK